MAKDTWNPRFERTAPVGHHMSLGDLPPATAVVNESTTDQRHYAARVVASVARDANECAELLAMLGLSAHDGIEGQPVSGTDDAQGPASSEDLAARGPGGDD